MARATLKDVAQEAGVSSATVSYILNGKRSISEETKARVMEAIKKLDYVPDLNARGLTMRDSKLIGAAALQTEPGERLMFQNSFYSEILGSIEYYARLSGYHILISATDANESYLTLAKKRNLDGIIVIGMYPDEFYQQMKKTQIPIVLIDSYCGDHYYHSIRIDDAYGSYLAAKHLLSHGHREIAFFCGQIKENGVMKKRLIGFQQALEGMVFRIRNKTFLRDRLITAVVSLLQKNSFPKSSRQRQSSARRIFWQSAPSADYMKKACACRRITL